MIPAIIILILAFGLVALVARPLFADARDGENEIASDRQELEAQVSDALAQIDEIDFDRASGHLSDEDFSDLSDDAKRRALELIRRRDAATGD